MLAGDEFGRLFDTFESSAFRLETLSAYDVDDEREEFEAFLAGKPMPPEWSDNPWVRSMTDRGKAVARVHVLRSPLTDYLRYELSAYPGNIAAGENIGIIDLSHQHVHGLPDHDFWLFDDAEVYRMHYTPSGRFTGADKLPHERLGEYLRYRDIAQAHAVPFAEYWEQRN
ncbi:DUF6879 family protein [Streptomyces sp. NPDC008001]|uniref:DUF6879 family protein n=1 Tax=Streptomyces sp. NPDC008001 TaxID=3364804 RepID=UPI0036EFFDAB